jgi:hypothetical protein
MMDTDHYTLCKVGLYLAISISTCLCKKETASKQNKGRRNDKTVYLLAAPEQGRTNGFLCVVPRQCWGWVLGQTHTPSFELTNALLDL